MLRIAATAIQTGDSLASVPPKIRAAHARAVTGLAFDVRDALIGEMRDVFDHANAFTLRAFRVAPASGQADQISATVWAMPRQAQYLRWEVEGGDRASKGFEHKMQLFGGRVAVPVGKFDSQFNRSPQGFVGRMLRDIAAGKRGRFFVGTPEGGDRDEGVWARGGRGGKSLVKVMSFESSATYTPKLDLQGVAQRVAGLRWESQLLKAIGRA